GGIFLIDDTGVFAGPVVNNAGFQNEGVLSAALTNNVGGTAVNIGTITAAVGNSGSFGNNATGTVTGLVTNASGGLVNNAGTLSGGVDNSGTFISTGIVGGGFTNRAGTASIRGQLNGTVDVLAGVITLSGPTTGIGRVTMSTGAGFDINNVDTAFG